MTATAGKGGARRGAAARRALGAVVFAGVVCAAGLHARAYRARVAHEEGAAAFARRFRGAAGGGGADAGHSVDEKGRVLGRLAAVARVCGALCDTTRGAPGGVSEAAVPCRGLYGSEEVDAVRETKLPPKEIPAELVHEYDMGGRVMVRGSYYDNAYLGKKERVLQWDEALVDGFVRQAEEGGLRGNYGVEKTRRLLRTLRGVDGVQAGRVLVIGSEAPWVEACALAAGAAEVVTLEYSAINSTHPRVRALRPRDFARDVLAGRMRAFDAVVSFSSLEHPGLGRYGDALNPWGDIIAVAKAWCVTKPRGKLVLEVPFGKDQVVFNAHRVYGDVRTPYLVANWRECGDREGETAERVYCRQAADVV